MSKSLLYSEFPDFFELMEQKIEEIDEDELGESQLINFLQKFNKSKPNLSDPAI